MRFIQISCLGASSSSPSRLFSSKAAAEEAVLREFPWVSYTFSFHQLGCFFPCIEIFCRAWSSQV